MNRIPIEPGRVVLSRAGRDEGRPFVVIRVEGEFAYTADGDLRRIEAPKKKKTRHLRPTPEFFSSLSAILKDGQLPSNAEIRRLLRNRPQGEG